MSDRADDAEEAPGEPEVRSWGIHDENGLSVTLTRMGERLNITVTAPIGLLELEPFVSDAERAPADG